MSGNPFRLSLHQNQAAAPAPPTSFINADSSRAEAPERDDSVHDDAAPTPTRTKKSVRIESPTSSPLQPASYGPDDALLRPINRDRHASPTLPASPAGFSDNFEDVVANDPPAKDTRSADAVPARGMAGASWRNSAPPDSLRSPTGAPINPFAKTLATIEQQEKAGGERAGQSRANARQSLDVEGFKNLLMKGIPSPRSSGQPPQSAAALNPAGASIFESSSSTDDSSASRQSIFEPVPEQLAETPRTSYEMAPSDDDERAGLVTEARREKKKPPPAPKHRHGKPVASRAPQTVSFEDFYATGPTTSPPASRPRNNSDLNKPLPPTPPILSPPPNIINTDITYDLQTDSNKASETSSLSDVSLSQKRAAPPVPIARRQSQLRTSTQGNRSRSNSQLTMSSQHSTDFPVLSPGLGSESTSVAQKAPPPPPPARRHGASITTGNNSSANSSTTELPTPATSRRPIVSSPTPPSSRRTTLSSSQQPSPSPTTQGLGRTSSVSSSRSNIRSVSNESATGMPPPPPPPRRRQSGRASLDKERPSLHGNSSPTDPSKRRTSIDSKRRTSVASESSLRYEYTPTSETNEQALYSPKEELEDSRRLEPQTVDGQLQQQQQQQSNPNILDDMEKFQREIDELREKYKQTAAV
ncbi:hypothetical protein BS50DRAFT_577537 [Corynespora cassiicola Philippines]|uniref:Uncharacterized protein n=1 Tax=Corynespora cassiicola Philippines TaxID=1448308 RepID=A0A2T2NB26_CORCC|nr:hypothetical protein BS50DRAFT_577537 [Corynespora cassiicola Philippines]